MKFNRHIEMAGGTEKLVQTKLLSIVLLVDTLSCTSIVPIVYFKNLTFLKILKSLFKVKKDFAAPFMYF